MNLSQFNSLKTLSAPAKCFFPAKDTEYPLDSSLCKTLPSNLGNLTVRPYTKVKLVSKANDN